MPEKTIIESWPAVKTDLLNMLSDTDAWTIAELKNARKAKDWKAIDKLISVMDSLHELQHQHMH
jgi:hypothetical protein